MNTYPEDFVKRVKEALPEDTRLHELLDKNAYVAGRLIEDKGGNFRPEDILKMLEEGRLEEFKNDVKHRCLVINLYKEWGEIVKGWKE